VWLRHRHGQQLRQQRGVQSQEHHFCFAV
jgi:hypothetical protein